MTYCINDEYHLDGTRGWNGSSVFRMNVKRCVGAPLCKTMAEIDAYLKNVKIETYFEGQSLNTSNVDNPIVTTTDQFYWDLVIYNRKVTIMEFAINKFDDHIGYLPTEIDNRDIETYYTTFDNQVDLFKDIDDPSANIVIG